jgi:ElaB/YqjD/DUF883 family membrane-anchored ribosome-binding protein
VRVFAIIALLISFPANASIIEGGRGMLFGANHAFAVTAKPGWVIDNQSGAGQGLHMVFYPKGETWPNSSVIIYGRSISTAEVTDVKTHVENTIGEFRKNGNPNYTGKHQPPVKTNTGQEADIYFYSGDQWGNYEAAAYFRETDTINYLVFNSRTKENFDKYLSDFQQIVSSYQNLYEPAAEVTADILNDLKSESSSDLKKPGGKEYETKAVQAVGHTMANAMRDCTNYISNENMPAFSYFVRIDRKGDILDSSVYPTNALSACFSGLMTSAQYPAHALGSFLLNMEMKITP